MRPSECALYMAEQLALDQSWSQRSAVHRNKRFARPHAIRMDRTRHQFFARSALTQDEDRMHCLRKLAQ